MKSITEVVIIANGFWQLKQVGSIDCFGAFIKLSAGMRLNFIKQDLVFLDVLRIAFANVTMTGNDNSIFSSRDLLDGVDPLARGR